MRGLSQILAASIILAATATGIAAEASFRMEMPALNIQFREEPIEQPAPVTISSDVTFASTVQIGTSFSAMLSASGGQGSHSFEFVGNAPQGWSISGNVLTGVFSALGSLNFSVGVVGHEASIQFSTLVNDAIPLSFTAVPGSQYSPGSAVSTTLQAAGNDGNGVLWISSGSLPPGLNLSNAVISGTVGGAAGATGSATIRVADDYAHLDYVMNWSLVAPAADTVVPVGARYRSNSTWLTLANHGALRDGNVATAVVQLSLPNSGHLVLDMGSALDGNSFRIAADQGFTFRMLYSDVPTSLNSWGTTQTYVAANGIMTVTMPEIRNYRYVGIQIMSAGTPPNITEFRYGLNGVFP